MRKYIHIGIWGFFPLEIGTHHCKKYLKHKERYTIEERFAYVQKLARHLCKRMFPVKFYITGEENLKLAPGQVMMVSNHNSALDPITFLAFADRPVTFLAKSQILNYPWFGKIISSIDASFIDREDLRSEIKVFRQIDEILEKQPTLSYVVYPEGTRSTGPEFKVAPFKGGSFKIATRRDLPIIPIATYLNARLLDQHYNYHKYPIQVEYLKPIMPEEYQGMTTGEIAELAQSRIEEALVRLKENDLKCIMDCNHYKEKKARKVQYCKYDSNKKR